MKILTKRKTDLGLKLHLLRSPITATLCPFHRAYKIFSAYQILAKQTNGDIQAGNVNDDLTEINPYFGFLSGIQKQEHYPTDSS